MRLRVGVPELHFLTSPKHPLAQAEVRRPDQNGKPNKFETDVRIFRVH
jgi:hypothetical protein